MLSTDQLNKKLYSLLPAEFYGTMPLDYIKTINSRPDFNKNNKHVCFIFNSDPSHLSGKHWLAVSFPPQDFKLIIIDSQALKFDKFNKTLDAYIKSSSRSIVERMPYPIQGHMPYCGIYCAFILYHLKDFNFNLHRLVENYFSDCNLSYNDRLIESWWNSL